MELSEKTLEAIGNYVKGNLAAWIREVVPGGTVQPDPQVLERIVRVEESLERQSALMQRGFEEMERRFEQVDKRFEQVDKRFEQVDKRFEQVEQRFEEVDKRFDQVYKRFEQVDRRFAEQREDFRSGIAMLERQGKRQTTIISLLIGVVTLIIGYGTFVG
jgi:septal ring factor EnvC (AmiA/AmiB activator)